VTSLTGDPPTLLVCVNRDAGSHASLVEEGRFSVSVLAREQVAVAEAFAGWTGLEGEDRFGVGDWSEGASGVPVLGEALVGFECSLDALYPRSTHDIVVGYIEHVHLSEGAIEPLVYVDRQFGGFAG
jgi:flavin reductase (DIM6/NTAB) family NADH-FMN oxidoreductase RutF